MRLRILRPDGQYITIHVGAEPRETRGADTTKSPPPLIYVPPLPAPLRPSDTRC